jgi:hypothetical protein
MHIKHTEAKTDALPVIANLSGGFHPTPTLTRHARF